MYQGRDYLAKPDVEGYKKKRELVMKMQTLQLETDEWKMAVHEYAELMEGN